MSSHLLSRYIVYLCYFLDNSRLYRAAKAFCFDLLENPQARVRPYFDSVMIVIVLLSIAGLIYEVKNPQYSAPIDLLEKVAVSFFIVEYLLRLWVSSDIHGIIREEYEKTQYLNTPFHLHWALARVLAVKWAYIRSPLAVIDLLAILPSYRPLRLLRLFTLFRVFKLFRYTRSVTELTKVLNEKRFELYTLAVFVGFVVFASATAIYLFDASNPDSEINTFFDAVYWALVTLSTVGYGDITPQSVEGRLVTIVLIVSGIAVLSFSTSIVVSAFSEKLVELRERRLLANVGHTRDFVLVCGYGRVGEVVAARLVETGLVPVVIDKEESKVIEARKQGYLALCENAARSGVLESLQVGSRARAVICVTGDDVSNVFIVLSARRLRADLAIIARANRMTTTSKLRLAGADHVFDPYRIVGHMAFRYMEQPAAFEILDDLLTGQNGMSLDAIRIGSGSFLDGCTVADVGLQPYKLLLLGVALPDDDAAEPSASANSYPLQIAHQEYRFYFKPAPELLLCANGFLIVFGRSIGIAHFRDRLERSRL